MSKAAMALPPQLGELEFRRFQKLIFDVAGIHISAAKRNMVAGRLAKRLKVLGLDDYVGYVRCIDKDPAEKQRCIDLLTTNETYFFREPKHFDFIQEHILPAHPRGQLFRAWSAACSSGEEAYSLAMLLADKLGPGNWKVTATDISTRVLDRARIGQYPMARSERIPSNYLKRYCLRGTGVHEGTLLVDKTLRDHVDFHQMNLNQTLPTLSQFDLVLLRNVLIYFNSDTKKEVVGRVVEKLKPGGIFMVGHSESLSGTLDNLRPVSPSIYQKL